MKRILMLSVVSSCILASLGCSKSPESTNSATAVPTEQASAEVFSAKAAKDNLTFAKNQYLKLIEHVESSRHLDVKEGCNATPETVCVPRSQEGDEIHMEIPEKWTNGFYPGVLWKLLSAKDNIANWQGGEEQKLYETALYYQKTLFSESKRGSTHDLGFILYDSFGEALHYDGLDAKTRAEYVTALDVGRATLATRYTDDVGLIRSWDWTPRMRVLTLEDGEQVVDRYTIANPWTYPVIVDNMMNLEYLFASDNARYHEIAFNHAKHTSENHYFYDESDTDKQYPLSYHVFDYGANKPGNWQGVGNVSAWARGQAWSLYGFVTVVEAMEQAEIDLSSYPDFKAHLSRLYGSIEHLLKDDKVPYWDFFAARENAYEYAENLSDDTAVFHGILSLCSKLLEPHILPYVGYRPMELEASMLSEESLERLEGKVNWYGEKIIQGDKLLPCGTKDYPDTHVKIPRDTSAAAIYAAALYRYANYTKDKNEREQYAGLADKIMAKLTQEYRTDRQATGRESSYELGFVLSEATGDFGNGGEIDTPIIYGDFYFIEANMRKLELESRQ
ncbi:thioredoxin domain-containing protein [Catenovulum agarivorans DS-2]|uniref:Thioredoxin domain-containing protein n=1 Tax=Catenovulum agarivorans DS-2 TaxID=1328313 RepID=W7QIT4_9ALTE|nr:hypothetical protein [Catenovulum agarivorans]EWH08857.1 thioredoxin domain-containing protein [Catenovulum agarivorans DS-2]